MNSAPVQHHLRLRSAEVWGCEGSRRAAECPVAERNAPQTNRAILPPEGGERAFEIMLPLQEAVEATTDVAQIRRRAL